jgi:hypothetical protein
MGIGKWVESAENLMLLCVFHHRGPGGVHTASASDFEGAGFIRNLLSLHPAQGAVPPARHPVQSQMQSVDTQVSSRRVESRRIWLPPPW